MVIGEKKTRENNNFNCHESVRQLTVSGGITLSNTSPQRWNKFEHQPFIMTNPQHLDPSKLQGWKENLEGKISRKICACSDEREVTVTIYFSLVKQEHTYHQRVVIRGHGCRVQGCVSVTGRAFNILGGKWEFRELNMVCTWYVHGDTHTHRGRQTVDVLAECHNPGT